MKNPYKILGVKQNASQDEIKKAYRTLVKQFHPDLNPGNKKAEEKFKEISFAYDLIGNASDRKKFDESEVQNKTEKEWNQYKGRRTTGPQSERYSQSFNDIFGGEDIFEDFFRSNQEKNRLKEKQERETHYQMAVSFRESVIGAEKIITLPSNKKLKIKIPPGIVNGTKLRFKNLGDQAVADARGETFIEINIEPLAGWKRSDNDLETELPISFIEGIMGAEISVETMYGPVMLTIPQGSNTGKKLRIKGKGIKKGDQIGNQIVRIIVMLPNVISPALCSAVRAWEGKFDYNPRSNTNQETTKNKNYNESRGNV